MLPFRRWTKRAAQFKQETYAVYLACRDPRVPWYAKVLAACVVAYAFSPIDLIPDFIPVLGYLDDLILVPLGFYLVLKLIPAEVMAECREKAQATLSRPKPANWIAAAVIIAIWIIAAALSLYFIIRAIRD